MVSLLIPLSASFYVCDDSGWSLLGMASRSMYIKVAEPLIINNLEFNLI